MTGKRSTLFPLFLATTGKSAIQAPVIPAVTDRQVSRMLGYWPDRTNRFKGW